jgi:hypothetical protein
VDALAPSNPIHDPMRLEPSKWRRLMGGKFID